MTTILITGGAGFIGSSLAEELVKDSRYFIVLFDNLLTGQVSNIPVNSRIKFIEGDVNNEPEVESVFAIYKFTYVFHYAAMVGVKRTLENPLGVLKDIEGVKHILNHSKNNSVEKVFFASSSEVYGEPVEYPQHEETTPLNSRLPYAVVKNVGEAYFKSYFKKYNLNYSIFRFFNTYGTKQSKDFVIARFINLALKNEDISIYGDGLQMRTFCYIRDNINFTTKVLHGNHFTNETINVGSALQTSILELAQLIILVTGSSSKIVHLAPLKEGDMKGRLPNNQKMCTLLQKGLTPLKAGIEEMLLLNQSVQTTI